MDIRKLFTTVNQTLTDVVKQITPEQLEMQAPKHMRYSDSQVLKTTINIMAYENFCVPKVLNGDTGLATNQEFKGDLLGDNPIGNYVKLSNAANEATSAYTDLDKVVHISYGDFPAGGYLSDISIQRTTSTYDIATHIGVEVSLPEDAVKALLDIVIPYGEYLREAGVFPPEIKVSDTATPEDKLLGFMGRQPS